jgi:hypothetical protein
MLQKGCGAWRIFAELQRDFFFLVSRATPNSPSEKGARVAMAKKFERKMKLIKSIFFLVI